MATFVIRIPVEARTLPARRLRLERLTTTGQPVSPRWASKLAGDAASLRGVPVLAPGGFGGAIRGTRPGDGLR